MRRRVSFAALCFAWLCANGVVWNAVQVVAWAKMFHDYAQVMPAAQALRVTFNGSAPCDVCKLTEAAQDAARDQQSQDSVLGGSDKLVLSFQTVTPFVLTAPDVTWPALASATGLTRTESVPVPPPRA